MNAKNFRARARHWWKQEIRPLLVMVLVLFSIRSSLADWNDVPTGSMRPTILEGDRVWVNKLAYDLKVPFTTWRIAEWGNPQRGDIAVFFSPHDGLRLVKRVVGLPGDTVELRNNTLILNGNVVEYQPIAEELLRDIPAAERIGRVFASEQLPGQTHAVAGDPRRPSPRSFAPVQVPEGEYFMMGDNRDGQRFDGSDGAGRFRRVGHHGRRLVGGHTVNVRIQLAGSQSARPDGRTGQFCAGTRLEDGNGIFE